MRFGRGVCPKAVKLAVLFVGIGFVFSVNAFAVGDLIRCGSHNNLEGYKSLHKLIKNDSDSALVYSLAITALCLGKEAEGMSHLQKASDSGHIAATEVLGSYYKHNRTINSSEVAKDIENLNNAIHYYKKAAQMIESTSNYPKGATKDMEYIESVVYITQSVFTGLPSLYLSGYFKALDDIDSNNARVSYTDTLDVLSNIRATAIMCVERPSLSVWKSKRDIIYKAQQIECEAYLRFAEAAYPLEQKRMQIAQNCQVPPKECSAHKKIVGQIDQRIDNMFDKISAAPKIR